MSLKIEYIRPTRRRPKIGNTGDTAAAAALNTYILSSRPRLLHIGPSGVFDSGLEEHSGRDWHIRWPYINGDDIGGKTLEDISPVPRFPDSKITVEVVVLAVHNTIEFWNVPAPSRDELASMGTELEWDFTLTAEQLDNGDTAWSSATSLDTRTVTANLLHWPTYSGGTYRCLQTAAYLAGSGPYEYGLGFHEGQLGIEDHAFLNHQAMTVDVSGHTSITPVRLTFSMTPSSTTPSWRAPATLLPHSKEQLRVYLVASTYVEFPDPPSI